MSKITNLKRNLFKLGRSIFLWFDNQFDHESLAPDVPRVEKVSHLKWQEYLFSIGNKPGMKILEIGSREVTGKSIAKESFADAIYIGFDYYPGDNVDVVGDAHKLSSYFHCENEEDKFDTIIGELEDLLVGIFKSLYI